MNRRVMATRRLLMLTRADGIARTTFHTWRKTHTASTSAEIGDAPEVNIMRAWLMFAGGIALYSVSQELVSPRAGSFFNVDVRGDINRQMAVAEASAVREGRMTAGTTPQGPLAHGDTAEGGSSGTVKHTWWWRFAHARDAARQGPRGTTGSPPGL